MPTTLQVPTDPDSTERSPLLQDSERSTAATCDGINHPQQRLGGNNGPSRQSGAAIASATRQHALATIAMCVLLIIILDIGIVLVSTGLLQVEEDIICHNLYGENPDQLELRQWYSSQDDRVLETNCKNKDVQSELSIIQSWQVVFDLLPGLIMAVPLGLVADRYGRSLVLGLSLLGITLSYLFSSLVCSFPSAFPLRFVWFSSLFNFIGGSLTVFAAMAFSIAADLSTEEQRSTTFFYLGAVFLGGAVLSNPVTYWVMETFGTWPAIYTGLCLMGVSTLLGFSMPETLNLKQVKNVSDTENDNSDNLGAVGADNTGHDGLSTNPTNTTRDSVSGERRGGGGGGGGGGKVREIQHTLKQVQHWLVQQFRFGSVRFREFLYIVIREEPKVGLLLVCLLFTTFGRDAQVMLQQYVVAKFQWSWSKAGLLISIQSLCSLLLLLVILPAITQLLLRLFPSRPPQEKDLWLARASILVQVIGALIIGVADSTGVLIPGVALQALGTGFNPLVRGAITNILVGGSRDGDDGNHQVIGLLYSVIAFIETAGTMVANPLLAVAFRVGLGWGGSWMGLPFLVASVLFTAALVIVGYV